jgi:hypothetical protein
MQTVITPKRQRDGAFYVRWNPEPLPYTIEIKLELVARIAQEIEQWSSAGEIGGILLGSFPAAVESTVRIDEVVMMPRGPTDAPVFLPNPQQLRSFAEEAKRNADGRTVVGLFRTHRRSGPVRPSPVDLTMVAAICPENLGALLLIAVQAMASLFLRTGQAFSEQPAVGPFHWDATELSDLPEAAPAQPREEIKTIRGRSRKATLSVAAVLCATIVAAAYAWSGMSISAPFAATDDSPRLAVNGDRVLRIVWNRHSPLVERASSAKLLIVDGENAREITLGANELRSGSVEYDRTNRTVQIMLVLSMPGDFSVTQSVAWRS